MTYSVVIARFNEEIKWIKNIDKKWNIYLYNKGSDIEEFCSLKKQNIGRESETYISHIINNYENLSDYISFCQGNPFTHSPDILNEMKNYIAHDHFYPFKTQKGSHIGNYDGTYLDCDVNGIPQHPGLPILDFCKNINLNLQVDTNLKFVAGAQFIINKKNILKHEKDFYINLNTVMLSVDFLKSAPYILERLWKYIF